MAEQVEFVNEPTRVKALFLHSPPLPDEWPESTRLQFLQMTWETAKQENPEISQQLGALEVNPSDFDIKVAVKPPDIELVDGAGAVIQDWVAEQAAAAPEPNFRPVFWGGTGDDPNTNLHFELVVIALVFGSA